jgi:hypothetical protein
MPIFIVAWILIIFTVLLYLVLVYKTQKVMKLMTGFNGNKDDFKKIKNLAQICFFTKKRFFSLVCPYSHTQMDSRRCSECCRGKSCDNIISELYFLRKDIQENKSDEAIKSKILEIQKMFFE